MLQEEGVVPRVLAASGFSGFQCRIRLVSEKLTIFPYAQYIVGIYIPLACQRYSQV